MFFSEQVINNGIDGHVHGRVGVDIGIRCIRGKGLLLEAVVHQGIYGEYGLFVLCHLRFL